MTTRLAKLRCTLAWLPLLVFPLSGCGGGDSTPSDGGPPNTGDGAPPGSAVSEWPSYGHDGMNTRYNPVDKVISKDNVTSLVKKWNTNDTGITTTGVTSTPAVVDGVVYFGDWGGMIHAVQAADGSSVWSTQIAPSTAGLGGQINDSPFVAKDRVYVGGTDNNVYALDRTTGEKIWDPSAKVGNQSAAVIWSSPNVVDDTMIIGVGSFSVFTSGPYSFKGNVVGMDATTGTPKWTTFTTEGNTTSGFGVSVWGSAAIDTKRKWAYIGTGQAYSTPASPLSDSVLALDYASGDIKWSHQFTANDIFTTGAAGPDWDVGASVLLYTAGGKELVGAGDKGGHFYALDRDSGDLAWTTELTKGGRTGGVMASPAVADGVIYVYSNDGIGANFGSSGPGSGAAFALDGLTGDIKWSTPLKPGAFGGIAVANGLMYFVTLDATIHALDIADGTELWSDRLVGGTNAGGGVAVAGGMLFAGTGWEWQPSFTLKGGLTAYGL